jgi:hypothetical protein
MACTAWRDVKGLIDSGDIAPFLHMERDVQFTISAIFSEESEKKAVGACLRWAAVIGDSRHVELMLQALPLPETFLTLKPVLRGDSTPVICIQTFPVEYRSFNGVVADGPVPIVYCLEAEEDIIKGDPRMMHAQLQKLAGIFAKPKTIGYKEDAALVKKPRPTICELAFKRKYKDSAAARMLRPTRGPALCRPRRQVGTYTLYG